MLLYYSLATGLAALGAANAQSSPYPTDLVGTWSTKSNQTLTGPGFYDPIGDKLIEPSRTGISYSFTADGHYEEAYYRAIANPADPSCPSAILQWQHGSWSMAPNGSLLLNPIAVDGRQLLSEPCIQQYATYTRYNQSELFKQYSVYTDPYHGILRLDLYQFNGAPLQPMYLAYSPPQMLPTTTLNPLPSSTMSSGTAAAATSAAKQQRRGLDHPAIPGSVKAVLEDPQSADTIMRINTDRLWWLGFTLTGVGGVLYLGPRRLGMGA